MSASSQVFLVDPGFGGARVTSRIWVLKFLTSSMNTRMGRADSIPIVRWPLKRSHPTLFVYPSTLIRRAAKYVGLRVYTAAAVSSLDTMLIDFDLNPGKYGLQIYDANAVLIELGLVPKQNSSGGKTRLRGSANAATISSPASRNTGAPQSPKNQRKNRKFFLRDCSSSLRWRNW